VAAAVGDNRIGSIASLAASGEWEQYA
jgi:hypothetical protein